LRRNPEILAAQKRYEAARQRPDRESSLPDPVLSLGYASNGSPRPFAGIGVDPTSNAGVMISQEFPFPGKTKLRGDVAAREAAAELEAYHQTQLNVAARVETAYHRLHHDYAEIALMQRSVGVLRSLSMAAEARYSAGKAAQADILRAQTQLSLMETKILRMEQDKRSREAEINSLVNRPPGTPVEEPGEGPTPPLPKLEELMARAPVESPTVMREQRMVERSELAVNLARKDFYPDYTLSAGYFNQGRMPDMYQFRVDFKLPAWFWRKQRAGVAEQAHSLEQARKSYSAAIQTLRYRIQDDYQMAETSKRLLDMYTTTVIPQANLTLQSSQLGYQAGNVDFTSLLMNFMAVLEFESNYHEELLNLHLALIRLEETTGIELLR
jgi:outer membrane protein, heavy metal efflux system